MGLFGLARPNDAPSDTNTSGMAGRLLSDTEKYWLFTPLQRVFCVTATLEPAMKGRLTNKQLSAAMLRVIGTPGFSNLACTLSQPRSESAAALSTPKDEAAVRQLVQRSISYVVGGTVDEAIERELAVDFDVSDTTVALWRLVALPDSGALVWTFQHVVGDGIAARDAVQVLLQHLSDETIGEQDELFVRQPLTGAVESLLPPALSVSSWVIAIRQLLSSPPQPFTGRVTEELPRSAMATSVHIEQLDVSQTVRARAKARGRDLTMHGLIVAASASALRLVFQPAATPCSFLTPISLRPFMARQHHRSVGNLLTAYKDPLVCSADSSEDDWQLARRYMSALKQSGLKEYRTQTILSWLGLRLGMASTLAGNVAKLHNLRKGTVEISNLGSVDIPHCTTLSFTSRMHNDAPLLLLGPVSVNGSLSLSLSYCTPLVNKEEAQRFVKEMIRFMTE